MNMTLDELKARAKADLDNAFEKGKAQGGGDAQIIIDNMQLRDFQWQGAVFPEGYDFVFQMNVKTNTINAAFMGTKGIKSVKVICKIQGTVIMGQLVRDSTVEVLDLTEFSLIPSQIPYLAFNNTKLVSILGELDLSNCTTATSAFTGTTALEEIRFKESTISIALDFRSCTKLSAESYDNIMQGLSSTATGQTLTLPAYETVKATYDDVSAYGEGAWDILTASKTNWTIAYS